jgi:transcriptional regulator with XRE-family HTH domain
MKEKPIPKNYQKMLDAVSSYLKELRYAENASQKEVSKESGLHRNTLGNVENSKNCTLLTIMQLCDYYQISASELLSIIE